MGITGSLNSKFKLPTDLRTPSDVSAGVGDDNTRTIHGFFFNWPCKHGRNSKVTRTYHAKTNPKSQVFVGQSNLHK